MSDSLPFTNSEKQSLLWVVVMLNMVFADILTFITPGALQEMMTGTAGGLALSWEILLVFAILIEIPIVMIFLSRALSPQANRFATLAAAILTTTFVIAGGSLTPHYIFFGSIEVLCMVGIVWLAFRKEYR